MFLIPSFLSSIPFFASPFPLGPVNGVLTEVIRNEQGGGGGSASGGANNAGGGVAVARGRPVVEVTARGEEEVEGEAQREFRRST